MLFLLYKCFCFLVGIACWGRVKALSPRITKGYKSALDSSSLHSLVYLASKKNVEDDGALNDTDDDHVGNDNDVDVYAATTSNFSRPSKLDLYNHDELAGLLEMHQQLQSLMMPPNTSNDSESTKHQTIESPTEIFAGGLHDLIVQTIGDIEEEGKGGQPTQTESWLSDKTRAKISNLDIKAIASDVDGTIVGFDQKIHPKTRDSIKAVQDSTSIEWIFPATGKTRLGAKNSLGSELSSLTEGPGVYVQVRDFKSHNYGKNFY